jgi:hypothetical protein
MTRQKTKGQKAYARIGVAKSSTRSPLARVLSPSLLMGVIGGHSGEQYAANVPPETPLPPTRG